MTVKNRIALNGFTGAVVRETNVSGVLLEE